MPSIEREAGQRVHALDAYYLALHPRKFATFPLFDPALDAMASIGERLQILSGPEEIRRLFHRDDVIDEGRGSAAPILALAFGVLG
jgi:hypothetical protein